MKLNTLPGTAETNIVIRIARRLIQIQRKGACITTIVSIASTEQHPSAEIDLIPAIQIRIAVKKLTRNILIARRI